MNWYPIFLREMLIFKRRLLRLGYVFSTLVIPLIYLFAFGLGIGRGFLSSGSSYTEFLLPGLCALSSMSNSYTWVANSLNLNRLYTKTFQMFIQSPIGPISIVFGEVLSGILKGLFAASLVMVVGVAVSSEFNLTLPFLLALGINCFMFSSLGVVIGMITKSHEDTATYSNFLIIPMGFFSGTFFPLEKIPFVFRVPLYVMPLTHTNVLIRKESFDPEALLSLSVMAFYSVVFFTMGIRLIRNYSE